MSRLSFRPRPLDIHKKLPILKSVKDFEDDDTSTSTRNSQILRLAAEAENEVHHAPSKKVGSEIPTPEFVYVDTYERDYSRTFAQPTSYIRARGARADIGEFVEYDLDNEDEDWLEQFNKDKKILASEKLEVLLFKLEVLDHKARERAGVITPTLGAPILPLLQFDAALESLQALSIKYAILESVYDYWKEKRERWQKPILRRLQPPPPVNDTNPYNVFRPREKAHRLHTRRMQRRENNVQSFDKLRQVRRNLEQAKTVLEALIKREEKKREVAENEVSLQRLQMECKLDPELLEDSFAFPCFPTMSAKFVSSEDEVVEAEDITTNYTAAARPGAFLRHPTLLDIKPPVMANHKQQDSRWRSTANSWLQKLDPLEPVMAFTKPLLPDKLASAGIIMPPRMKKDNYLSSSSSSSSPRSFGFHGRIGRGGRIIFDRWNPISQTPLDCGDSLYISSSRHHRPPPQFM